MGTAGPSRPWHPASEALLRPPTLPHRATRDTFPAAIGEDQQRLPDSSSHQTGSRKVARAIIEPAMNPLIAAEVVCRQLLPSSPQDAMKYSRRRGFHSI